MAAITGAPVATWVAEHKSVCGDFKRLYRRCVELSDKTEATGLYADAVLEDGSDVTLSEIRDAHNLIVLAVKTLGAGSSVGNADRLGTVFRLLRSEGV
jgi:hypothetical protein